MTTVRLSHAELSTRLRWQYRWLLGALAGLPVLATSALLLWFAPWLAHRFGLSMHRPVKHEPNGDLWFVLILTFFVASLLSCHVVCFAACAPVLRWRAGWNWRQTYRLFFHSEVPSRWLKTGPSNTGQPFFHV